MILIKHLRIPSLVALKPHFTTQMQKYTELVGDIFPSYMNYGIQICNNLIFTSSSNNSNVLIADRNIYDDIKICLDSLKTQYPYEYTDENMKFIESYIKCKTIFHVDKEFETFSNVKLTLPSFGLDYDYTKYFGQKTLNLINKNKFDINNDQKYSYAYISMNLYSYIDELNGDGTYMKELIDAVYDRHISEHDLSDFSLDEKIRLIEMMWNDSEPAIALFMSGSKIPKNTCYNEIREVLLERGGYFDYFKGRGMKCSLNGDKLRDIKFSRYNGFGLIKRHIRKIRAERN